MKENIISESMFKEIVDSLSEENMKEFILLNGALEYYGDTYYLKGDEKYDWSCCSLVEMYRRIKGYRVVKDSKYMMWKVLEELNDEGLV